MKRKLGRAMAAVLAVSMALPANLPVQAQAAKTVTADSSSKGANESISSDYSYEQIGTSDFYLRYLSEYTVNPGQTVDLSTAIVKKGSGDTDYTIVADTTGYTYKWERKVVDTGNWQDAANTTNTMRADSDASWYDEGISTYRLTVTHDNMSEEVTIQVEIDHPYSLTDGRKEKSYYYYKTMGENVVLDPGIQVDPGYTAEYSWQQYVGTADSVVLGAPASANTSTDPSRYAFTPAKEADYGEYVCTVNFKDANGVVQDTYTRSFYVIRDSGLVLYDTSTTYRRTEGASVTMGLDNMYVDASRYQMKYVWYKDGEKLTNALSTYTIQALTKEDFAASYRCEAYAYPITATAADMEDPYKAEESVSKAFYFRQITALWAYTGEDDIEAPVSTKVVLEAFATNMDPVKYPITYKWYKRTISNDPDSDDVYTYEEIPGQTGSTYTMETITAEQFGSYKVQVSDGVNYRELYYHVSEDYGWQVNTPSQNVVYKNLGESVDLTVNVVSAASYPITYRWYKRVNDGWQVISGAIGATYSLALTKDEDFTDYRCIATNGKGDDEEDCKETFLFSVVRNDNFWVRAVTEKTQYKQEGSTATFKVAAGSDDASAAYEYSWEFRKSGDFDNYSGDYEPIPNANTDTLVIGNINMAQYGTYIVTVENLKTGQQKSLQFRLNPFSNVIMEYATDSVLLRNVGEAVTMGANVSNPENKALTYIWEFVDENGDATTLDNQNTTTLTINSLAAGQYGEYTCYALYNNVVVDYLVFVIKKDNKSYLEAKASTDETQYVALGSAFTLGVTATTKEGRALTYQWYEENSDKAIYGATANTYSVAAAKMGDIKNYYCEISDGEDSTKIYFSVYLKSGMTFTWAGGTEEEQGNIISMEGTAGKALTMKVTTVEDPSYPTYYQWYYSKTPYFTSNNRIAESNEGTYTISALGKDNVGYYACDVANAINSYTVYFYVYFDTGLVVKTAKTEYEAALGAKVNMKATVSSKKKYPATMQWYYYDEDYEYIDEKNDDIQTTGKYVAINGANTATYSIASVTKDNYGDYKLEVKTDGETYNAYFQLSEAPKIFVKKATASTDVTLPGSKITLNGKVTAPEGAQVEYQWFVEDAITHDMVRAKTAAGKNADKLKVTVKAPSKIVSDDTNSDVYEGITYRLRAKSVIDGKTETSTYSVAVMVVNPTMSKKAPKSAHNYKAGVVTTYGYKASGNTSKITATFDKKTSIDKDGDCLYLVNGNGKATVYYGNELKGKKVTLAGNKFAVVLVSNNEDAKSYGFEVSKIAKTSSSATPSKLTVGVKEKIKIKGIVPKGKKATYKSSKKKIAAVNKKGVITAKKTGKAVITVKYGKNKKKITVTVKKAPKKLKLAKKKVTVKRGKSTTVKYSIKPSKAASYTINVKNAKALKKAKLTVKKASGNAVSVKVAAKAKKKTYKVTVATYNGKKAILKVKVK